MRDLNKKRQQIADARSERMNRRRAISLMAALVVVATAVALMVPAVSMTRGELVCDLEEHQHSDTCYEQVLVCGYDDAVVADAADDEQSHAHSDACYELRLVCEMPDHVHSSACYAEPADEADDQDGQVKLEVQGAFDAADSGVSVAESDDAASDVSENANGSSGEQAAQSGSDNVSIETSSVENGDVVSSTSDSAATDSGENSDSAESVEPSESSDADADADASVDDGEAPMFEQSLAAEADLGEGKTLFVRAEYGEGVLPEGATMQLSGLPEDKADGVIGLVKREAEAQASIPSDVCGVTAADVQFLDVDGSIVQPQGPVTMQIAHPAIEEGASFALLSVVYADVEAGPEAEDAAFVIEPDEVDLAEHAVKLESAAPGTYALAYVPPADDEETVEGDENADEDDATSSDEARLLDMPATTLKADVKAADGSTIKVAVEVDEETFPKGVTMKAELVTDKEVIDVAKAEAAGQLDAETEQTRALAVDITFYDAEGNPIEPAKDVRVSVKAREIAEQDKLAIVHVDDEANAQLLDSDNIESEGSKVSFDAAEFSVYAVVYTVDFHWQVDGKTYNFSIPGGGFVSLQNLVELLGIADGDTHDENGAESAENAGEGADAATSNAPGENGSEQAGRSADGYMLAGVDASEETKTFVADVADVEFSSPELVDVSRVESETTVGEIKNSRELEVQHSAELSEKQIAEIDAQTVEAGDWALIGMKPFASEEALTVTMKDGEVFTIRVTDAQISTHVITADGKDYVITVTYGDDAQIPDGARLEADEILPGTADYEEYVSRTRNVLVEERELENDGNQLEEENREESEAQVAEETAEPELAFARFFDIRIMAGSEKIEPSAPVKVTVAYTEPIEALDDGNVCAIHFAEKGIEVIEASSNNDNKEVAFTQDSFSVTGTIVTTGDDWPSSNGKYLMYVKSGDNYFAVAHDGSLAPVTIDNGKITISLGKPIIDSNYLWTYEARSGAFGGTNRFVYYNNGSDDVYLDPREDDGLNDNYSPASMPTLARNNGGLIRSSVPGSTNKYIGVNDNSIAGAQPQSDAVPVQFASMPLTLTVHFVDREGHPLDGVSYGGNSNYPVTENSDGTYSIPYNWGGTTGTIDLENDFSKSGFTYGSSHIAGTRDGVDFTHNGLTIDAVLTEKSDGSLNFKSDCGDQYANPRGNLGYGALPEYDINGPFSVPKEAVNATTNVGTTNYFKSGEDRDIYVVLDPVPSNTSGGTNDNVDVLDPSFDKELVSNGDGTYTLSLSVTGAAKNTESNPKANVVFIIDTSSSMRKNSNNPNSTSSPTRLEDTKAAAEDFADALLSNNTTGDNADKIEIAMVTFDGSAVSSGDWYTSYSGSDGFKGEVDKLVPANMHTGTDWEDALQKAYELGTAKKADGDATYVVFFTDGEPSQYTNFNGTGEYTGQNRGYRYWYSCFLSREASNDEARAIVNSGMTLYSIFAYNPISDTYAATGENGSDMLHNLTRYAYNTSPDANLTDKRFFHAENTAQLNDAFASILNSINEYVGVTDVKINDSITSLTSVGITTAGGIHTGFKYTRSGGNYGAAEQEWEGAPQVSYDSTGVHWDLGNTLLEEGVTYKVSFVVWPSQEAYDWVADLNNGIRTWADLEEAHLQDHFLRVEDSTMPSGYRYEVATNPRSKDDAGHILNNLITYKKTHREIIGNLPEGVTLETPPIVETDPITGTKTTTTYTLNPDGTYTKTVVTEARDAFGPPDLNMDLNDTKIKVQKKWVADRLQELVAFLFNTSTGDLKEDKASIDFVIKQSAAVAPYTESEYKTITLGFKGYEEVGGEQVPIFDWADEPQDVEVNGRVYSVGTIWEEPMDIAVGLMLTPDKALEHGIDLGDRKYIPVYASEESTEVLYYVLEKGHDYEIEEPSLDFRFEFQADKYHPMLVNKVLRDVKITYKTVGGREIGILGQPISLEEERLGAMVGKNVLRGELTVQKDVLDLEGEPDTSDDARSKVFPMTVVLTNNKPVFYNGSTADEQNVPWIGVQHGGGDHIYYYHKFLDDGTIQYADEGEACVNGDYNQGLKDGYYGHAMTAAADMKSASETIYLTAADKWTITNVPLGTTYTITEGSTPGYQFVSAEELESDPEKIVTDSPSISGEVPSAHVTEVLFTNRKLPNIVVKKTDDAANSTNYLSGAVFKLLYRADDEGAFANVSNDVVPELDSDSKFVVPAEGIVLTGLVDGQYQLQEVSPPSGYIVTDSYPVTFTVSGGTITSTEGTIDGVRYAAATETSDASFTVPNTPGVALPTTGGSGTQIFTILGSMLIVGAGALLWRKRRLA